MSDKSKHSNWFARHRVFFISLLAATAYFAIEPVLGYFYYDFRPESFVVLHNVMEAISIVIAFMCFGIAFHSHRLSHNSQNLVLGVAFLCIGIIDVFHALSYAGMPAFITPNTINKATQLWILARITGAAAFLAAAFIRPDRPGRILEPYPLLAAGLAVPVLVLVTVVMHPDAFPAMFVPGEGLTPLKIDLEYAIVAAQFVAAALFYNMYRKTHEDHLVYFIGAMVLGIFSELFFTLYASPYDIYNFMGHVYKVGSYFFIYYMLFVTSVEKPYGELTNARDVLREYSEHLEDTVLERTRELTETNRELVRLGKLKDDFLAMCSHDMRSPLHSSLLFLELLLEETDGPLTDAQRKSLEAILKNERQQLELISNLLVIALHEEGLKLNLSDVDVGGMLRSWAENQRLMAAKKGITFNMEIETGLKWRLDAFKIGQALYNLAANALKFTPSGGEIRLAAAPDGPDGPLRVSMFNSGPAIPRGELESIFNKYERSVDAGSSPHGGIGLGLHIARTNIELHGGKIWAESEEGVGNTFTFTIQRGGE